jgi:membrane-anchored protein YejM (alkaline phosphatase superfamily)
MEATTVGQILLKFGMEDFDYFAFSLFPFLRKLHIDTGNFLYSSAVYTLFSIVL